MAHSHNVGMVGEGLFIAFASGKGWHVYRGLDGHTPCDYVVDTGSELLRVEVKRVEAVQATAANYYYVTCTNLDTSKFDYIFVSTPVGAYWIPARECPKVTLAIKVTGEYSRNITRAGKYEAFRVEPK